MSGVITTALYGLLKQGKANCCELLMPAAQENGEIFSQTEMEGKEETPTEIPAAPEPEKPIEIVEEQKVEKPKEKEPGKKSQKKGKGIGTLFLEWFNNATSDPEEEKNREEKEDKYQ